MGDLPFGLGDILEGDYWPEPVRVLTVTRAGTLTRLEVVGTESGRFYGETWLSRSELASLKVRTPQGFTFSGDGEAAFLALEARRIRLAHLFDPLQAVHTSQVDPLPHQIDAVYHHMLRQARLRFLLADDPGAGKTIMAGLLLKELKYRSLVERTLIVVPGHLIDQWLREMRERFWETFRVVNRATFKGSWRENPWRSHPQLITSMDFAKQEDVLATLAEADWDLVIVDEAHKLSAWRYGDKTKKTQRYRLGEVLSRASRFLLFLTATPHRGDPENFRLLLELLEPGMYANVDILSEAARRGENILFLRRLKEDLKTFDGVPLFPPRHVRTVTYRLSPRERELYGALTRYVREQYNLALNQEKRNVAFALLILQRRLASSVRAARRSLERRRKRLSELLKLGRWLSEQGYIDEEALEDAPELERWRKEEELIERLTAAATRNELEAELAQLEAIIQLARRVERSGEETKLVQLRRLLDELAIRDTKEKLLIFTESRDTMEYLVEQLSGWGYSVVKLHGGMGLDERIRAEHEFKDLAQVMVSTEAGGEGINLQFCSLMVNYDIPWNPNRLEQRMGRIHRYGQRKEVFIYNLVAEDTVEGDVLRRLFKKLEAIRQAMGSDRVFDVIQEVIPGRSLADLIVEALTGRRTLDEIAAEIERIPDEEALRRAREAALEALATRHIDLKAVLGEERRAKEMRLVPEYIERFFVRACRFLGVPCETRRDGHYRLVPVPVSLRRRTVGFQNRYGEVQRAYRDFTFYKEEARRSGAELVAPGHPLLEAIIEEVIAKGEAELKRGAAFVDPSGELSGTVWFVEAEVRDGSGTPAGKRLYAVFQPPQGELRPISSGVLWDLKPAAGAGSQAALDPLAIQAYVAQELVPQFLSEIKAERERQAGVKERYGLRSFDTLIGEAEADLLELETRRAKGEEIPEPLFNRLRQRREELEERRRRLVEALRLETTLVPGTINLIGAAAVSPLPQADELLHPSMEVERVGMELAMAHERGEGRQVEDVSMFNLGYDLRSLGAEGDVRYIEVKARATTGPIILTPNEWLMAHRLGDEYWLYIVENATQNPTLHRIRNPASVLQAEEKVEVVRYLVRDWKRSVYQRGD